MLMAQESAQLRGSHHCIGTGRTIADLIFKIVHDKAVANGGAISAEQINSVKAEFIVSLPSGMEFFERINRQCMAASGSAAPDLFCLENILATLLSASGNGSARYVFRTQIQKCGPGWLDCFFQGLSQIARKNLSDKSWQDLIGAYVHTAEIDKADLQVSDLIARNDVKAILSDSMVPFYEMFASHKIAISIVAKLNSVIARKYNLTGFSIVKVTDVQMEQFLTMLQKEMSIKLPQPIAGKQAGS